MRGLNPPPPSGRRYCGVVVSQVSKTRSPPHGRRPVRRDPGPGAPGFCGKGRRTCLEISLGWGWRGFEFLVHPGFDGFEALRAAEEVLDQVGGGLVGSGLEDGAAVTHGGWAVEEILLVELGEEVNGDDLVEHVGVVVGGVTGEVCEGGVEVVSVERREGAEAAAVGFPQGVEVEGGRVLVVELEREGR